MNYLDILQYKFLENTIQQYLVATAIFVVFLILAFVMRTLLSHLLVKLTKRTKTKLDDTVLDVFQKVIVFVLIVTGIYFALKSLIIPQEFWIIIEKGIQVLLILKIFQGITVLLSFVIEHYFIKLLKGKTGFGVQFVHLTSRIVKFVVWLVAATIVLNVFGYDITALVAGLGIGGLAIALAAQDPLTNFFSSVAIIADKQFKTGDIIKFGDYEGIIENVGLRSTRIRTFFGTYISVPNNELSKSIIENVSKRNSSRYDGKDYIVQDGDVMHFRFSD